MEVERRGPCWRCNQTFAVCGVVTSGVELLIDLVVFILSWLGWGGFKVRDN